MSNRTRWVILLAALIGSAGGGCAEKAPPLSGGKPVAVRVSELKDPDPRKRKEAAEKLGNVGPTTAPEVVQALIESLRDRDPGVRSAVVIALSKCRRAAGNALPLLLELKQRDPNRKVRDHATRAIAVIQNDPGP
jgi:HEAT repeat protein